MTALSGALAGLSAGLADISVWQVAMIAAVAFVSAVMSGMAGYGIGLILPLVLVPLVGAQPVVPIVAMAGLFMNASRLAAFFRHADLKRSVRVAAIAAPTCALGAYGFTPFSQATASRF